MQPTQADRLNFSIDTAQESKRGLIVEYGLGEPLPVTLMAWSQGELKALGKVHAKLALAPQVRFEVVSRQAFAFRKGVAADALTLLCEGFSGAAPVETLPARFGAGDLGVRECLVVVHMEEGEEFGYLTKIPFTYHVGRAVAFDNPHTEMVPVHHGFPAALATALLDEPNTAGLEAMNGIDVEVFE